LVAVRRRTLSTASGDTTTYKPPAAVSAVETATLTASTRDLSSSVSITINPGVVIPVLTVSPLATRVVAGGAAVTFTALLTGSTAAIAWTLAGEGSLSATSGATIQYTPPAAVLATETAALVAFAAGLTSQASITIGSPTCDTGCETGSQCVAGLCLRTVASAMKTAFTKDDGTTTLVDGWAEEMQGATVTALLSPDSASISGYTSFPVTAAADGSFSVGNVPEGAYFVQVDTPVIDASGDPTEISRSLYEFKSNTPDLTLAIHGRANRTAATQISTVNLNVTALAPLADPGAERFPQLPLVLTSAQAPSFNARPRVTPAITPGSTSVTGSFNYDPSFQFLPDASQGDVTYLYQRSHSEVGTGANLASYYFNSNYLRSTSFTLTDGGTASLSGAMLVSPQTGTLKTNMKLSQFAALASQVHPSAQASATFAASIDVFALPHAATFIELQGPVSTYGFVFMPAGLSADLDYGNLPYGRLPESSWGEFIQMIYIYDLTLPGLLGSPDVTTQAIYLKDMIAASEPDSIVPALGPPTAPLLNGNDAFVAQSGAGTQPTVSWSPPSLGVPTSYQLSLFVVDGTLQAGDVSSLNVVLYSAKAFKVPAGSLRTGLSYAGTLSAVNSADTIDSRPLQSSLPSELSNTNFGVFSP
jgi:hypothetical protein